MPGRRRSAFHARPRQRFGRSRLAELQWRIRLAVAGGGRWGGGPRGGWARGPRPRRGTVVALVIVLLTGSVAPLPLAYAGDPLAGTASASPSAGPSPDASPAPDPTAEPTPEPTAKPTPKPTAKPTARPAAASTPTPAATPEPSPAASSDPAPASAGPTPPPAAAQPDPTSPSTAAPSGAPAPAATPGPPTAATPSADPSTGPAASDPPRAPADPAASDPAASPSAIPDASADPGSGAGTGPPASADPAPSAEPGPSATPVPSPAAVSPYLVTFASAAAFAARGDLFDTLGATETGTVRPLLLSSVALPADRGVAIVAALRGAPGIGRVEPDRVRAIDAAPGDPRVADQWALPVIGWPRAHEGDAPTGQATVAILDTGVDATHPDLAGPLLPGTSFVEGAAADRDPNGHGTAMAGIVAAATDNGIGIAGTGFAGVRVLPVTVMDAAGDGRDSDIVAGVVDAVDRGADVILMAFSSRSDSAALRAAIDYAWSRGAVVVSAVGNDASDVATYPAGDPDVLGVAATDPDDRPWAGGNRGAAVSLAAPGTDILTTAAGGGDATVTGTSASAALVAAAAALLRAREPGLPNDVVVARLLRTAHPAGTPETTGAGRLDLAAAWADGSMDGLQPGGAAGPGGSPGDPYQVALTCSSQGGGGSWNQAATWSCGRVPGSTAASDAAVVTAGNPVTVSANTGTTNVASLTVDAGATLGINNNRTLNLSSGSLTVNGTLTITGTATVGGALAVGGTVNANGTLNANGTTTINGPAGLLVVTGTYNPAGEITVAAGGTYRHNRNGGTVPAATWDAAATLEVTGWTNATDNPPAGFNQSFGNVTWNAPGQTAALSFAGTMQSIRGTLTVASTGSGSIAFGGTGIGDTTIGGNLVVTGGTLRGNYSQGTGATRSITVRGGVLLTGGTLDLNGADDSPVTVYVARHFTATGGTLSKSGANTGGVVFNGTAVQTYTSGATITTAVNFTVSPGATLQMADATTLVAGTGTFTLAAGATLGITSPAGIAASGAAGNVQVSGTRTFSPGANYTYDGTGNQVPGSGLPAKVHDLAVAKPAGDLALAATTTVTGTLRLSGGNLVAAGVELVIATGGAVSRTSGHVVGTLRKAVPGGSSTVTFEIGDASAYTPVTVAFASVGVAGDLAASTTAGEHPGIATSPVDGAQDANRWWTLAATAGLTFTTASATFTFAPGDVDGGANPLAFVVGRYAASAWTSPTPGTRTATTTQATGLAAFGQFAVGAPRVTASPTTYVSEAGWGAAFSGGRHLDLAFPPYVAAGSTVATASFHHVYRSQAGGTTCTYLEVYSGATLIGTHGSAAAPVSCATTAWVTDDVPLPEVDAAARANAVTVRIYVRNSAGGRSEHEAATLNLDYALR